MEKPKSEEQVDIEITIDGDGHVVFDLGPRPPPDLLEKARQIAADIGGATYAETSCLTEAQKAEIVRRLASLAKNGGTR